VGAPDKPKKHQKKKPQETLKESRGPSSGSSLPLAPNEAIGGQNLLLWAKLDVCVAVWIL
jgi:hypothetical protein